MQTRNAVIFFFFFSIQSAFGQIVLKNPSFEGGGDGGLCGSGVCPIGWNMCESGVCNCAIDLYVTGLIPDSAFDGKLVACILVEGNTFNGSFSQKLDCNLNANYVYSFQAAFALIWDDVVPSFYKPGPISVFMGNDTCDYAEMIYLSPILDTIWQLYDITFTPQNTYNTIIFRGVPNNIGKKYNVNVDALSPISILNAHQIHSYVIDTLLPIGSTACLNLTAYTDTTYKRVWWEQVGIGLIDNQLNAGTFCTDTNTTYIIHMLGADSTCAGYLHSSDTVRVRFYDPNSSPQTPEGGFRIYPNPATNLVNIETEQSGTFTLTNSMGQVVEKSEIRSEKSEINCADWPSGVYYYRFTTTNKLQQHGKLVKQ